MQDLNGKIAVVTGGASGIGFALAERFAREGMNLVVADIEPKALDEAAKRLAAHGTDVLAVPTDVSDATQMDALGEATRQRFGTAHVVCNNAGVAGGGPMWELSTEDWEFVLGPNIWGVIHGVRVFAGMLRAQGEGHIVNTASMAGMISVPGLGPYNVSKHAVVTLSETLYGELAAEGSAVGVSVLCPGFVATRIFEAERHRPEGWEPSTPVADPEERDKMLEQIASIAIPPEQVANAVLDAIRSERFYIFTHANTTAAIERRMQAILGGENPPTDLPMVFAGAGKAS